MKNGDIEIVRKGLKELAAEKYAGDSLMQAGANLAVDAFCDAKIAEVELNSNTITSYSIQGRSITKRNIADIPWVDLTADLLHYFTESEIPFRTFGNRTINVDFSGGAR